MGARGVNRPLLRPAHAGRHVAEVGGPRHRTTAAPLASSQRAWRAPARAHTRRRLPAVRADAARSAFKETTMPGSPSAASLAAGRILIPALLGVAAPGAYARASDAYDAAVAHARRRADDRQRD